MGFGMTKQIYGIVNDAVKDALGQTNGVTQVDTSSLVSMGKAIDDYNLYEGFYGSLVNRIAKTIYMGKVYKRNERKVLRDFSNWGAYVQTVYTKMPQTVESAEWEIPSADTQGGRQYIQASPFDVENVVEISANIYGGRGAWAIEIVKPISQMREAFLSESEMMAFISAIDIAIRNKMETAIESTERMAVNTGIASAHNGGKSVNILSEYNAAFSKSLTVATCLADADFLKYVAKRISETKDRFATFSTLFNVKGWENYTRSDELVLEVHSDLANALDVYLQADTYHKEMVALPNYVKIPFWASSGNSYAFTDTAKIDVKNDAFISSDNETGAITITGVIANLRDIDAVAGYFGNERSWEFYNPRSNVMVHGETADRGFGVNEYENNFVFYIAD